MRAWSTYLIQYLSLIYSFMLLQNWTEVELNERGETFHQWIGELEKPFAKPDSLALVVLATMMSTTLMIASCDGYWSSDQKSPGVVLAYMGEGLYARTKVGKFSSLVI